MVRFLILTAVAVVLVVKLYLLLTVMDRLLGIYSFLTTFILFNILTLAWLRYRDPYHKAKDADLSNVKPPLISIVVPVKNEEDNIRNCVMSCVNQSYKNKEVIIVDDASTDNTPKILDQIRAEVSVKKGQLKQQVRSLKEKFTLLWIATVIWQVMPSKKQQRSLCQISCLEP
jgi:cellulose synthase/poly-beta-1,6-N-acetylglucosamine synthase-like glycosyltransferase